MNTEITKTPNGIPALIYESMVPKLEAFTQKLNEKPATEEIKINKAAKNSKYLPISFVRIKLDEMFAGIWNFTMIREQVIANEIIGVGILEVFHPVANTWIKRSGTAAVMIQQVSKDNGGSGRISNIDDKIKNTLVKDFPHLESECLKSAAKKLGKMFGGDLNREHEDSYEAIYSNEIESSAAIEEILPEMESCKTIDALVSIWNKYPDLHANTTFKKYFSSQRQRINLKAK